MMFSLIKLILFIAVCLVTNPLFASMDMVEVSYKEKYLKTIEFINKNAKDIYCYWDIKKQQHQVDWQFLIAQAKARIDDQTSFEAFQEILTELAAGLHDGHVNYLYTYKNKKFYLPIQVRKLHDGYYISQVEQDKMSPYPVDLHEGDKIIAVNNQPIEAYIDAKSQYISASTINAQHSYAAAAINTLEKFKTAPKETLAFTVLKFDTGQEKTVELPWIIYERTAPEAKPISEVVKSKILPGNIGVLTLTQMAHEEGHDALISAVKQEMAALRNTKALLIDVRNNGGGWGETGDTVVSHFITQPTRRYQAQLKNSAQAFYDRPNLVELFNQTDPLEFEFSEWLDFMIEPLQTDKPLYSNPVYVLTNERCFSACDTFVDSFSSNHIGQVLGAQTAGGTGYPLSFELPWNFGNFRFSTLRGFSNHGRYLEGTGTIPDVRINATPKDLYLQLDGELIAAYDHIINRLKGTHFVPYAENSGDLNQHFTSIQPEIIPFYLQEEYWQKLQSM